MANEEHLDLLTTWTSTGDRWKSVWRKWKIDHPTIEVDLTNADFHGVNLKGIDLKRANLYKADLRGANLTRARLYEANLSNPNLSRANLTGCYIYATSAWNGELKDAIQLGLIITTPGESDITIDNLEVAQFIYLLLNNEKVRDVIDTVTSKVVLILGRFMDERKKILNALRMTGLRVSKNHSLSSVTVS